MIKKNKITLNGLKVLVAFEESQEVCKAFRKLGFETYSCDIQECSGGHPEWHLNIDALDAIRLKNWDLIIMHPPCTYVAVSGNRHYAKGTDGWNKRLSSSSFISLIWNEAIKVCKNVVMENPVGVLNTMLDQLPKPQYIQPWQFGHGETKKTGLWLHGLPQLIPTNIVEGREQRVWKMPPSKDRAKLRSKTFPGIAEAMAQQWGDYLISGNK